MTSTPRRAAVGPTPGGPAVPPPSLRRLGGTRRAVATQPPATARPPASGVAASKEAHAQLPSSNPRTWTIEMEPGTPIISANHRLNRYALNRQVQDLRRRQDRRPHRVPAQAAPHHRSRHRGGVRLPAAAEDTCGTRSPRTASSTQTTSRRQGKRWSMASGACGILPADSKRYVRSVRYILADDASPRAAAGAYHRSGEPRLTRAREADFSGPVSEGNGGQR